MYSIIQFYLVFGLVYSTHSTYILTKTLSKLGGGAYVRVGGANYEQAVSRGKEMAKAYTTMADKMESVGTIADIIYAIMMVWTWLKDIVAYPISIGRKLAFKEFVWVNRDGLIRVKPQ